MWRSVKSESPKGCINGFFSFREMIAAGADQSLICAFMRALRLWSGKKSAGCYSENQERGGKRGIQVFFFTSDDTQTRRKQASDFIREIHPCDLHLKSSNCSSVIKNLDFIHICSSKVFAFAEKISLNIWYSVVSLNNVSILRLNLSFYFWNKLAWVF